MGFSVSKRPNHIRRLRIVPKLGTSPEINSLKASDSRDGLEGSSTPRWLCRLRYSCLAYDLYLFHLESVHLGLISKHKVWLDIWSQIGAQYARGYTHPQRTQGHTWSCYLLFGLPLAETYLLALDPPWWASLCLLHRLSSLWKPQKPEHDPRGIGRVFSIVQKGLWSSGPTESNMLKLLRSASSREPSLISLMGHISPFCISGVALNLSTCLENCSI